MATPVKNPLASCSQISDACRVSENSDPNIPIATPSKKPIKSPAIKSASKKSVTKTPKRVVSPPPPPRERKFIVAKKNSRRGYKNSDVDKCRQAAYDALRASQEDFFRKDHRVGSPKAVDPSPGESDGSLGAVDPSPGEADGSGEEKSRPIDSAETAVGSDGCSAAGDLNVQDLDGSSMTRKIRSIVMEEALISIPEPGSGRVKHLVKAFESLLSISEEQEGQKVEDKKNRVMNWALPGLQQPTKDKDNGVSSSSSIFSSAELFPSWGFRKDLTVHSSMESNGDRLSWGSRTSSGGRRSRRNSTDSCGRNWNKMLKVTNQNPFKLRTEQRGRIKEVHFIQKVKEMLVEEEKNRIPIAQGLPWTTDEPEVLVKPPIKESTEPIDLVLHSDVRAVERAEFDHYVTQRLSFAEQMRLERERQQKLEEEEEIRRLRRELVPRAQPMPYFDRPFIPKKSTRHRTVPKEPRFHLRPMKPSCISMLGR